jgi:hypothetical protein
VANIEHWAVFPDGRIVGSTPFPERGQVVVRLADRNREVYELREQLRGAVDALEEIAREAAEAPMEDGLDAGGIARAALDRLGGQ